MPTLRRYVNDPGYYVVAAIGGKPVTFQLTKEGEKHLIQVLNLQNQSHFDVGVLFLLIERRWAYTNRSGPGDQFLSADSLRAYDPGNDSINLERVHAAKLERHVVIRLESADQGAMDTFIARMMEVLLENAASVLGPLPLPTRRERYRAISASQVRDYWVYTHKRILTLVDPESPILAKAGTIDVPPGVDVKVRETTRSVHVAKSTK
jgi:small subunit ribosomal protein S10